MRAFIVFRVSLAWRSGTTGIHCRSTVEMESRNFGERRNGESGVGDNELMAIGDGQNAEIDDLLLQIGFEGDPPMIAPEGGPSDSQMLRALGDIEDGESDTETSVLSWSGGPAARSIENVGDSLPSIAERTGGYDEDVLEYARSVHQAGTDVDRGLSQYGERQVETEIDTQTEYHRASQEDRDIDLDTLGSRDGRIEFAIGDVTGSPTAWSEIERQQERTGRMGNGERTLDTETREEVLELEDVRLPGSQRAAVDIAVAERLRESGVLTEDDICAAAYLDLGGNEPLASIHEDGEVASRSGGMGRAIYQM